MILGTTACLDTYIHCAYSGVHTQYAYMYTYACIQHTSNDSWHYSIPYLQKAEQGLISTYFRAPVGFPLLD